MDANATTRTWHREGFALPVAVFAMVVVGVLVTGGFYMARQETRIGVASQSAQQAFYLAERGIYSTLANWDAARFSSTAAWSATSVGGTDTDGTWKVDVLPMTMRLYFLRSTGTVTSGGALWSGATRQVGMIARVNTAVLDPPAALTALGDLTVGGSSQVDGMDTDPSEWSGLCTGPSTDKPGVLVDDATKIMREGQRHSVDGDPAFAEDPSMTTSSLLDFGDDYSWSQITALAEKVYAPNTNVTNTWPDSTFSGGAYVCQTSALSNWGDPLNPAAVCGSYFPIIYARGNFEINSSSIGQGILLVEGDLRMTGGFTFYGPVYVRGRLITEGTGGHFNGGVVAANVDLSTSTVLGAALVTYSSCAVERAILGNSALSRARPLARRSWVDVSSISF